MTFPNGGGEIIENSCPIHLLSSDLREQIDQNATNLVPDREPFFPFVTLRSIRGQQLKGTVIYLCRHHHQGYLLHKCISSVSVSASIKTHLLNNCALASFSIPHHCQCVESLYLTTIQYIENPETFEVSQILFTFRVILIVMQTWEKRRNQQLHTFGPNENQHEKCVSSTIS